MTQPPAFAGDKLGFELVPGLTSPYIGAQKAFGAAVENARAIKRRKKDLLEMKKETVLGTIDKVNAVMAQNGFDRKTIKALQIKPADLERVVDNLIGAGKLKKQWRDLAVQTVTFTETQNIKFAKDELKRFVDGLGKLGWQWSEIEADLKALRLVVRRESKDSTDILHPDGTKIATVWFGNARLKPSATDKDVLVQKGYDAESEFNRRRKEYVLDANGVPTRRYVSRGISHYHLATMLGLNYSSVDKRFVKDMTIDRQTGAVREPGQYPRGGGRPNIGGHADTFDVTSSAVVDPDQADAAYGVMGEPSPMPITRVPSSTARTNLDRNTPMTVNERTSMQVRNGSGPDQTMLSAAAVQETLPGRVAKIIRGNKGDRFDTSEEAVAMVEVDLAAAARAGIQFVNVHSNDSHHYKVAYRRYTEAKDGQTKRSAREELDEYIYSGQKNREVTIDKIPNSILSGITLGGRADKWDGCELGYGKKMPFTAEVLKKIKGFMTDLRLSHLVARATEEGKSAAKL